MTLLIQQNDIGEVLQHATLDRRRRRLSTVVKRHVMHKRRPHIVSVHRKNSLYAPVDETVRLRKDWKHIHLGPEDVVVITYLPLGGGGGGGGGAQKAAGLAMLVLAIFVPYLVGAIAPAIGLGGVLGTTAGLTVVGKIVAMGIIAGIGYLLSKATQPKGNEEKKTYGVSGGGNLARTGERIPVNYGKTWTQPDLAQNDYFSYSEIGGPDDPDDQTLYKRMVVGLGPYRIETIKVGDAVAWIRGKGLQAPFDKMQIEFLAPGQKSTLVPSSVYSSPNVAGIDMPKADEPQPWVGPFPVSEPGERAREVQLDYSWPQGFWAAGKKGRGPHEMIGVYFEICQIDDDGKRIGPYTSLWKDERFAQANGAVRISKKFPISDKKRWAVRARNRTPKLGAAQLANGISVTDTLYWDGLRGWMGKEPAHPNTTEVCLKVSANAMGSTTAFSDVWLEATKILPVWNGSSWVEQPTRSAIWAAVDAIRNQDYGGAVPDSKIDLATFLHYADALTRYNTFDGQIRGPVSVVEAANTILGVVRGEAVVMGDVWTMTRDEPRAFQKHMITRREIVKDSSGVEFDLDMTTGESDVIVSYLSECDPKRKNEVRETIGAQTITPRRIDGFGISSIDHARHIAKWYASIAYYRRENRLFTTEMQGRIFMRNEAALVDTWFLNATKASAGVGVSGTTVSLDSDLPVAVGDYVMLRDNVGVNWGPCRVAQGGTLRQLVLDASDVSIVTASTGKSLAGLFVGRGRKRKDVSVLVGPLKEQQTGYLIRSAKPSGPNKVDISALLDAPEVWAILGETVDIGPEVGGVVDVSVQLPILPWIAAEVQQLSGALYVSWSLGRGQNTDRYQVQIAYGAAGTAWSTIHDGAATEGKAPLDVPDVAADPDPTLRVRARMINRLGVPSAWLYTSTEMFRVKINPDLFDLDVTIEAMSAELRKKLALIDEAGEGSLIEARERLNKLDADLNAAIATNIGTVHERIDRIKAVVSEQQQQTFAALQKTENAYANANEVLAKTTESLFAQKDADTKAIINEERLARVNAEGVLAQRTLDLQAKMGADISNLAEFTDKIEVRVTNGENGMEVVSRNVTTLSTTLGDNTARLTQIAESVSGVSLRYGVTGTINSKTGGFLLSGAQQVGGGVSFLMEIAADLFVDGSITGRKLSGQSLLISGRAQVGELVIGNEQIVPSSVTQSEGNTGRPARVTMRIRHAAKVEIKTASLAVQNDNNARVRVYRSINGGGFVMVAEAPKLAITTVSQVNDNNTRYDTNSLHATILFVDQPNLSGVAQTITYEARYEGSGFPSNLGPDVTLVVTELAK